jgi:hypothetical protein
LTVAGAGLVTVGAVLIVSVAGLLQIACVTGVVFETHAFNCRLLYPKEGTVKDRFGVKLEGVLTWKGANGPPRDANH